MDKDVQECIEIVSRIRRRVIKTSPEGALEVPQIEGMIESIIDGLRMLGVGLHVYNVLRGSPEKAPEPTCEPSKEVH